MRNRQDPNKTVSWIDTSGEKQIMMVEGRPFFYTGVQISNHRLMSDHGWSWPDMEKLFKQAAEDGFTVIGVPIAWLRIEPVRDGFDWTDIDTAIDYSVKHGIHLEILWFGSDVCTKVEGCPDHVIDCYQPVLAKDGTAPLNVDGRIKLDKTDPQLLEREKYVLHTLMNHIRSYIQEKEYPRMLVGVQVLNEPTVVQFESSLIPTDRSYSPCADELWSSGAFTDTESFNTHVMYTYLDGLARTVKESDYCVWTRTNWCVGREVDMALRTIAINEDRRLTRPVYLDFIGNDPYTQDAEAIYSFGRDKEGWHRGKNLYMTMENGGGIPNTAQLIFNCLAGDGVYHIWEQTDSFEGSGMYQMDKEKDLIPREHVQSVREMLSMLRKNQHDLAVLPAGSDRLVFFNRLYDTVSTISVKAGNCRIRYSTECAGAGIMAVRPDTLVFMSTEKAQISLSGPSRIRSLEKGFYDTNNEWISQDTVPCRLEKEEATFEIGPLECIRVAV